MQVSVGASYTLPFSNLMVVEVAALIHFTGGGNKGEMQLCFGREEGDVSGSGNTGFVFNSDISLFGTAELSVF